MFTWTLQMHVPSLLVGACLGMAFLAASVVVVVAVGATRTRK